MEVTLIRDFAFEGHSGKIWICSWPSGDEPWDKWPRFLISRVFKNGHIWETQLFAADSSGTIRDRTPLPGSSTYCNSHEKAIRAFEWFHNGQADGHLDD